MIFESIIVVGILILFFLAWFVYQFIFKLYIVAAKLKKMDPTLKNYISPFTGLNGVQKKCV